MSRLTGNQKLLITMTFIANFKFINANNINRDQFGDCFPSNLVRLKLFGELHGELASARFGIGVLYILRTGGAIRAKSPITARI